MSLDERIRAARPVAPSGSGVDLDAAAREAVRSGRRRRRTYRASAVVATALTVALGGGLLVGSLVRNEDASMITSTPQAGDRIVFSEAEEKPLAACDGTPEAKIFTMKPDGSQKAFLAEGGSPRWSPDGRRIVYQRSRLDDPGLRNGPCDVEVWMMNADGTDQRLVGAGARPTWSPDGARIAFTRILRIDPPGYWQYDRSIWVVDADADGSTATPVTHAPEGSADLWPDWSPDGLRIVFSRMGTDRPELWVVDLAAGDEERLCCAGELWPVWPVWSPDGSLLAFTDGSPYATGKGPSSIFVVRADGSRAKRLTSGPRDGLPTWSPDGTRIAFVRIVDGAERIFVMNADGSGLRRLGSGSEPDFPPTPD